MRKRLSSEDRHAVDLLLERPDGHGDVPTVNKIFARPAKGQFERRLDAVEKILNVLNAMPTPEPSGDLVSRTMRRIEEAKLQPTAQLTPEQTLARDTTTHA